MKYSGVYIVLATYNGERYLADQICSIQAQSLADWTLLVSDDGSTDQTLDIVRQVIRKDPRVVLLPPRDGRGGHVGNFEYLLDNVLQRGGDCVFLADQDDIWEPGKLETLLAIMEQGAGKIPAVFSDLEIVDSTGHRRGSFLQSSGLTGRYDMASILCQNFVVGCSLLVTVDLLRLALPFPRGLENHDWWLAMCAYALGQLAFSPEKLVNYRQHAANTIGSKNYRAQLTKLGSIVYRQRRVFESKIIAVDELLRRLQVADIQPPAALLVWQRQFAQAQRWGKPWQLLVSEFKPDSRPLLLVQLLALSPLIRNDIKKVL